MQAIHAQFLELFNGEVQYVVPRWQRRYRWDKTDIERLVEDLLVIAESEFSDAAHYGGALLTFPVPAPAGGVTTHRVVDGQQRLTTVSILIACISEEMESDQKSGWNKDLLRNLLTNHPSRPADKRRKLRLQDGDEEEYHRGLEGKSDGSGAVAQAWQVARRLVKKHDVHSLLRGIERFRVVSISLGHRDDPQQIFESLNATGRPLTESEKVKNWLLMGLEDDKQQDLHQNYWLKIEKSLGVERTTEPVDMFLRDFLRWKTGQNLGRTRIYEEFRRWALRTKWDRDRPGLCRELKCLAKLYGILTGTVSGHPCKEVERVLRHLRAMGIDVHRPLTLRLLYDAKQGVPPSAKETLAETLEGVSSWITRLWLANRSTSGLNTELTRFAHSSRMPNPDMDYSEYWLSRIRNLRSVRTGMPSDKEVREGILTRKAYGASATRSSFAVLCALMEQEPDESKLLDHSKLSIEHIMPRKLTDVWKQVLGEGAEELHEIWLDRFANLTLCGHDINSGMGAGSFQDKRGVYATSSIAMTRRLAEESGWNEATLEDRANYLAERALKRWPWKQRALLEWRIGDGPWRHETMGSQMVLNVAGALLSLDSANAEKLSGDVVGQNIHPAIRYPAGKKVGALMMRAIPGHGEYVMHPSRGTHRKSADYCREMGQRCGVKVEVGGALLEDSDLIHDFWKFFKQETGGVYGQRRYWRDATQWAGPVNDFDDWIRIHLGRGTIFLDVQVVGKPADDRVQELSQKIRTHLTVVVDDSVRRNGKKYPYTVGSERAWTREARKQWSEAARWIKDQYDRLLKIAQE